MALTVDLNCDCGEGFGAYEMGDDEAMLAIVTSASVACGFHAGDPDVMARTFAAARAKGVTIGAHPGYPDLKGFGRRPQHYSLAETERLFAYQIGAAQAVAALAGARVAYVKPHGALSNLAMTDKNVAGALARATRAVDPRLGFLAVAGTATQFAAEAEGLATACEIYADRGYDDAGLLLPRGQKGAVIEDAQEIAERVLAMAQAGGIISSSGRLLPVGVDSICLHGNHKGAVAAARAVRARLEGAGVRIAPFLPG